MNDEKRASSAFAHQAQCNAPIKRPEETINEVIEAALQHHRRQCDRAIEKAKASIELHQARIAELSAVRASMTTGLLSKPKSHLTNLFLI